MNYSLYLILDDGLCSPDNMLALVNSLIDCGITCVQLRMKHADATTIIKTSQALLTLLHAKNIPLIINDHLDIAAKVNADGIHLGQNDMPYQQARHYLGQTKMIGLSIENNAQARQCREAEVDYFGVGPVFSTTTKRDAGKPLGVQQLKIITELLPKPVVAIGGINLTNLTDVMKSGVAGIAISSAILAAANPAQAVKQFARELFSYREKHG